jgi:class 3 adenylate cyclase
MVKMASKKRHRQSNKRREKTTSVKYIYLDVVSFTQGRSVEAQSQIIASLNKFVLKAIRDAAVLASNRILIPTGDGMCIAILQHSKMKYDVHLQVALRLLRQIHDHSNSAPDPSRRFSVRLGINENDDNLITDINKRRNVAGPGVNLAQRIMSLGDANQILVGQAVYDRLFPREPYMHRFQRFEANVKHGDRINVYQYRDQNAEGLDSHTPHLFAARSSDAASHVPTFRTREALNNVESFQAFLAAGTDILVIGVTLLGTIGPLRSFLAGLANHGATLRFLLLDPESPQLPLAALAHGTTPESLKTDIASTLIHLKELAGTRPPGRSPAIQWRLLEAMPTASMAIRDGGADTAEIRFELYLYRTHTSARPAVRLTPADEDIFTKVRDAAEALWNDARTNGAIPTSEQSNDLPLLRRPQDVSLLPPANQVVLYDGSEGLSPADFSAPNSHYSVRRGTIEITETKTLLVLHKYILAGVPYRTIPADPLVGPRVFRITLELRTPSGAFGVRPFMEYDGRTIDSIEGGTLEADRRTWKPYTLHFRTSIARDLTLRFDVEQWSRVGMLQFRRLRVAQLLV